MSPTGVTTLGSASGRPAVASRPGLVLAVCCTSLFLVTVDGSIVHVALPSIQRDLGGGVTGLQWGVDGYLMVMASLLVLAGSLADRLGRRRVFVTGLGVFAVSSLLCGLAPSVPLLVAARVLQGVGAAMLNPVALSTASPPERNSRGSISGAGCSPHGVDDLSHGDTPRKHSIPSLDTTSDPGWTTEGDRWPSAH